MTRNAFGDLVKKQRTAMGLSQRQLAPKLGIQASHIAYMERGMRKPSLALLGRMAGALGLDGGKLFFLLFPEARELLGASLQPGRPKPFDESWRQFVSNRALLKQHDVTRAELKILKQVSLLRRVSSPRHFLFVLNSIRLSGELE
jgi:transcriptional regulator with XRE-family HTH domain